MISSVWEGRTWPHVICNKAINRNNGGTYHLQRKIGNPGWKIKCFAPFLLGSFRKYGTCFEVMHFFRINLGFRGNWPPTPPLNQHFSLDEKKGRARLVCLYRCFYFTPRILRVRWVTVSSLMDLTWENNREFATRWYDVWGMNAKIPYWWRVTTQIWVVLLIGWSKFPCWHD